jgi:hypothetical protein
MSYPCRPIDHQHFLREYAQIHDNIKTLLTKNNNTYDIAPDPISSPVAYNSTATKYFNSKDNVSTAQEHILSTLLTGLTFRDLLFLAVSGFTCDLTATALHSFEHQMYSSFTHCGQRIEADLSSTESPASTKLLNRPYFGGAIAEFDVYTGHHVDGFLVNNSMARPLAFTVQKVEVFSVDQGVNRQSLFREAIPEVQRYLNTSNPNRAKPTVLRIKNMLFVESKSYEYYTSNVKTRTSRPLSSLASRSSSYGVNYSIGSWSSSTL